MIFAAYSWRLEKSFFMNEFAKPQSHNSFLDETSKKDSSELKEFVNQVIDEHVQSTNLKKLFKHEEHDDVSNSEKSAQNAIASNQSIFMKEEDAFRSESILNVDSLREVSSMLSEDSDSYDIWKLFKWKLSVHDLKNTESVPCKNGIVKDKPKENTTTFVSDTDAKEHNDIIELFASKESVGIE